MNLRCDFINYENCNVSREAIHKRFNPEVVAFLKELASKMISSHLKFASQTFTQSCCFNGIYVKDTTKLKLPTIYFNSYPCYGGHNHELSSLMNIQYEYDLLSGNWNRLELTQATQIFDNLMERMVRAQPCPYKHIIAKMTNSIICL